MAKYFSRKVTCEGITFDSTREMERYYELKALEKAGKIERLQRQVRFEILPALTKQVEKRMKRKTKLVTRTDERAKYYTADFVYLTAEHGYIEDVKSKVTAHIRDYPLRRHLVKLMLAKWNAGDSCPCDSDGQPIQNYWIFKETL